MDPLKAIRMAMMIANTVKPSIEKPLMRKDGGEIDDETQTPASPVFRRMAQRTSAGMQPTNIVKEKGGQWLAGSIESHLEPLITPSIRTSRGQMTPDAAILTAKEGLSRLEKPYSDQAEITASRLTNQLKLAQRHKAVNDWIGTTLKKYIQRDMGTEHDPVRALAERGILHVDPDQLSPAALDNSDRKVAGKTDLAKEWEKTSDSMIKSNPASYFKSSHWSDTLKENPWIQKLDPQEKIHRFAIFGNLGFDHLRDELHTALSDHEGLPKELQLRPESLQRMSVPQAVEHVHKINEWRKNNRVEANKKKAFNPATHLHKDYPDSDYAWYELKAPENEETAIQTPNGEVFTNEEMQDPIVRRTVEKVGANPVSKARKHLQDALDYEGDVMGHCVGGYTDSVLSGGTRIFSLRNKKTGEPHVTIETSKSLLPKSDSPEYGEDINQIKGKGNAKPVDRYIPFVQDFVKSGDWKDVGDFANTDLLDLSHSHNYMNFFHPDKKEKWDRVKEHYVNAKTIPPRYVSKEEFENPDLLVPKPDIAKAAGGIVDDPQKAIRRAMMVAHGMARGGQQKFEIMPPKTSVKAPENFTPYDSSRPTMLSLGKAFDEAIAHHLSLSPEERIANSYRAANAVADHIGRTSSGKPKDLLGKNAKLLKTEKGKEESIQIPDGRGVETTGLALAPAYEQGNFKTCPNSASCKAECLGKTSGNYFKLGGGTDLSQFKGPRLNSLLKTFAFLKDPHSFAVKLHDEIQAAKDMAAANGNHLGVRLNVLSDINPRVHRAIINAHPDVTFYDYTKNNTDPIASNHHYTYSSTGVSQPGVDNPNSNWKQMRKRLDSGDNVAMAFSHKDHLPEFVHDQETGKRYKVVNGDTHDFRPLDLQPEGEDGVIIGLKNKKATGTVSNAHRESNGFFVHYDPQLKMAKNSKGKPIFERTASTRISPKTGKPMLGDTIPQNREVSIMPQDKPLSTLTNDGEES